ncbi:hypothetical protein VCV18_008909 [Metarhizium anisopliae]
MHFANLLFVIPFTAVFAWPLALTHHTCAALVKKPDCKNPSIVRVHRGATRDLRVAVDGSRHHLPAPDFPPGDY